MVEFNIFDYSTSLMKYYTFDEIYFFRYSSLITY